MISRKTIVALSLAGLLAACLLAFPASRLFAAGSSLSDAQRSLDNALHLEHELQTLRAATPTWLGRKRPTADVAALLYAVLKESRLAPEVLVEVTPQEASGNARPDPATGIRWGEQGVSVRLNALPLPDLGSLLDRWRDKHPEWAIGSIDLQARERPGDTTATFSATIRLTATFVE